MNLYDVFRNIDSTLSKNVKNYDNSVLDKFIDELRYQFGIKDSLKILEKLPKDTIFGVDRFEGGYAICENETNGLMYDIPAFKIDPSVKEGTYIKLENGIYKPL